VTAHKGLPEKGSDRMTGVHHYLSSEHKHKRGPFQSMLLIQQQLQLRQYNVEANGFSFYINMIKAIKYSQSDTEEISQ